MNKLKTSEMVCKGHPDKLCDYIADSILDDYLSHDKDSRVAVEVAVSYKRVFIFGEVTSKYNSNVEDIARKVISEVGYNSDELGFNGNDVEIIVDINKQSSDIAMGVNKEDVGAGDQGIIFGYACSETDEYLPLSYVLSSKLARRVEEVRKEGIIPYLRPDGKMQVTVEYKDNKPYRIHTILLSTQHNPSINGVTDNEKVQEIIKNDLKKLVIDYVFESCNIKPDEKTIILINPSGRFVIGGPQGDSGLTGRKIIVDTYGGYSRHGGGAFSGKDPTKVDRSAAYASRYVAKNIVASGLAEKCEIELAYAIGVAEPLSIMVDTFGTGKISDEELSTLVSKTFDLTPARIINKFDLRNLPKKNGGKFYQLLAAYGHMGRTDINVPWEMTDKADELRQKATTCGCGCI